jgi:thiamine-phosphate pyrophosphorylase
MTVDLSLYVLVDPAVAGGKPLDTLAALAARGGATLVQLRDKAGSTRALVEEGIAIKRAVGPFKVPFIVNDRIDVALASGADGVHIGREDLDARAARRIMGPRAIIGVSIKNERDVAELVPGVVDYACVGGVFATTSKNNPDPPVGVDGLKRLLRLVRARAPGIPVGAIAGIDEKNAAEVIGAGADGIAVISAVIVAKDPESAARRLRTIVDNAKTPAGTTV